MAGAHRLWSGPIGADLTARALAEIPADPSGIWVVPSSLARDRVVRELSIRRRIGGTPRVWCWDDLWRAVGRAHPKMPARLSAAGARAVLGEAIGRARREGGLVATRAVVETPGFRRLLRRRIAEWTRAGRSPRAGPPEPSPVGVEGWAVFRHYRDLLRRLKAEDDDGFAAWASGILGKLSAADWPVGWVAILEPTGIGRAGWRFVEFALKAAPGVGITLPFDPEPSLAEVYAEVAPIRDRLLALGFAEEPVSPAPGRPAGLDGLERELFREDAHLRPPLVMADGLSLRGAPRGEGVALVVASRVRYHLKEGAHPDDVLVLFRRDDETLRLAVETLRSWGIAAAASSPGPLAESPAVAALLLAIGIPEGWETARLVRLLRSSQFRPDWPELRVPLAAASAATALRESRVFRGRDALRSALERAARIEDRPDAEASALARARRAREARPVLQRMMWLFEGFERPASWEEQVERLQGLIRETGIGTGAVEVRTPHPLPEDGARGSETPPSAPVPSPPSSGATVRLRGLPVLNPSPDPALGHLMNALDDHGAVLEGLRRGDEPWSWADFAREVEAIARALAPDDPPASGVVRVATVDAARGARARHVLLADLAEGTFPAREAVDPDAGDAADEDEAGSSADPHAFAREMLRFVRVAGSADESLDLLYPTADEKGQAMLPAGFLDEVRRRLSPTALETIDTSFRRLDPAVLPAELVGTPGDTLARASALALLRGEEDELKRLAADPRYRVALEGTAAAIRAARHRSVPGGHFDRYDGRLRDPAAVARIGGLFDVFSPSQLESLVSCPFQFFLRYILKLDPIDERDEFDDDRTRRGSIVHKVLEQVHRVLMHPVTPTEPLPIQVREAILQALDEERAPSSDVDSGLREIETSQLLRVGDRYVEQFVLYAGPDADSVACRGVEVVFGPDKEAQYPPLAFGQGDGAIRLRGKIDRIDVVRREGRALLRVIDYKTGSCPGPSSVTRGEALQLPLYALAAERVVYGDEGLAAGDFGYWALAKDGYKAIRLKDWEAFQERLEAYVMALAAHLRRGEFPIAPRREDCTGACDYRTVCRIVHVRAARKAWPEAPRLEGGR